MFQLKLDLIQSSLTFYLLLQIVRTNSKAAATSDLISLAHLIATNFYRLDYCNAVPSA